MQRRDLVLLGLLVLLLGGLALGTCRDRSMPLPPDAIHQSFAEAVQSGKVRMSVEQECRKCHDTAARPLSRKHPPKHECLVCHRS